MTDSSIRERISLLVEECSDGSLRAAEVRDTSALLSELGLSSLARMRLIDAVEAEFEVEIDLDERGWDLVDDPDALATHLAERLTAR
ncbi:acyl carrier protein [Streptacidiphilus sp. MAP12-20]|uniref:phosphopantetheine-binding protein n=1 Tax=Streptacidiphilus sp. MAP12-20 TaxID=3156299 RepID=UPI003514909C